MKTVGWGGSRSRFLADWLVPGLHWQQSMKKSCKSGKERDLRDKKKVLRRKTSALEYYHICRPRVTETYPAAIKLVLSFAGIVTIIHSSRPRLL